MKSQFWRAPRARGAHFGRSRSGNVAMLWAIAGGALMCLIGLSIDFARAQSLRSQLQNAVDGAVLVAERSSSLTLPQREAAARAFFDESTGRLPVTGDVDFEVTPLASGGHRVEASARFDNQMSLLAGLLYGEGRQDNWRVNVAAEAQADASPPIEVALVLDNTGSMSADMEALRDAAEDLATDLLRLDGDSVSVALVPFVAQVNVGNGYRNASWMDSTGISPYNGELLEDRQIAIRSSSGTNNCTNLSTLPYAGYTGPYRIVWVRDGTRCRAFTPDAINYFALYDLMPGAPWKGCVEMRAAPYDVQDTPATTATPATLFSPYFWVDTGGNAGASNSTNSSAMNYRSHNSYLTDTRGNITGATMSNSGSTPDAASQRRANWFNVFKWRGDTGTNVSFDTSAPDTRGPNRGCPTPIVPLTTNEDTMVTAIRAMQHWSGGGTNQAEGLAWGWRVLSPGEPFTQGRAYGDDVRKVIVLMSDGENTNVGTDDVFQSDYSSLNHLGLWADYQDGGLLSLLGLLVRGVLDSVFQRDIDNASEFVDYINDRERLICENIKDENIEIYTVIFRETDTETEDLMRDCASGSDHFYRADNAAELASAFDAIGSGIGELRLTR